MNTRAPKNRSSNVILPSTFNSRHDQRTSRFRTIALALAIVSSISLSACGGAPARVSAADSTKSSPATSTATPTPTPTAPKTTSCVTENAMESYPPKDFICTKNDAGLLVWMEKSESKKVTDARAAAAAKAAAEKAAAEKAAAEKAAAEKAAAEKAAADQAAAQQAAAQQAAAAEAAQEAAARAAAEAAARQQQAAPPAPSGCDPNYAGACVPIASDVDCAGGGGNGPAYVSGPFRVVGSDIYGLDSDHDGIACER